MNVSLDDNVLERIKQVIIEFSEIQSDLSRLTLDDNLFNLGMSSRASVNLMMGLESEFDIEFPDEMMRKEIFESIGSIGQAVNNLILIKN